MAQPEKSARESDDEQFRDDYVLYDDDVYLGARQLDSFTMHNQSIDTSCTKEIGEELKIRHNWSDNMGVSEGFERYGASLGGDSQQSQYQFDSLPNSGLHSWTAADTGSAVYDEVMEYNENVVFTVPNEACFGRREVHPWDEMPIHSNPSFPYPDENSQLSLGSELTTSDSPLPSTPGEILGPETLTNLSGFDLGQSPPTANHSFAPDFQPKIENRNPTRPGMGQNLLGKIHRCNRCTSAFSRAGDLRRHYNLHFPERRKFHCRMDGCNRNGKKGFYRRDKLRDHQKQAHIATGGNGWGIIVPGLVDESH